MAFSCLTYEVRRSPRWNTFLVGLAIDGVGVLVLITAGAHFADRVSLRAVERTHFTLIAPDPLRMQNAPAPNPVEPRVVADVEKPKLTPQPALHVPPPQPSKIQAASSERLGPELPRLATAAPIEPVRPVEKQPAEKIDAFSSAIAENTTVRRSPHEVQTGGFGDPNGVSGQSESKHQTVTVASVGSFDMPSGPEKGNGTGGNRGLSGTVHTAGFSDEAASSGPHQRSNGGIASSEFGDAVAAARISSSQRAQKTPELQPIEIVYKPRPAYTPEARRQRVEGEVLIEVVFTASGSLHINRVVKGLGYGLDDTALAAAQRIQFRPARRDGQPYDCAALVHMVFELTD